MCVVRNRVLLNDAWTFITREETVCVADWLAVWDSNRPLLAVYVDQLLRKANANHGHAAEGGGPRNFLPFRLPTREPILDQRFTSRAVSATTDL
jgi:hypothetical protein